MTRASTVWLLALVLTLLVASAALSGPPAVAQAKLPGSQQPVPGGPVVPLPDLTVSGGWTYPEPPCAGKNRRITLNVQITNKGPGPVVLPAEWTKPWATAYLAKPVAGFVQPYATLGKATTLQPGQKVGLQLTVLLGPLPPGNHHDVIVMVDPKNLIKETDEGNNTVKFPIVGGC
jgi:hypothetical protein